MPAVKSVARTYIREVSWVSMEQVLRIFTNLAVSVWLIRYLGPSLYGVYAYVVTFTTFAAVLARMGMQELVVKELVGGNTSIIATAFRLKFYGALVIYAGLIATGIASNQNHAPLLYIAIAGTGIIFQSLDVLECYLQASIKNKMLAKARALQNFSSSLLKIALILSNAPLPYFIILISLEIGLLSTIYFIIARKENISLWHNYDGKLTCKLLRNSWPIALSQFAMTGYAKVDQLLVFHLLGKELAGQYAAVTKLSEAWQFLPTLVATTLFPALMTAKLADSSAYRRQLRQVYTVLILISVAVAGPVSVLARPIVQFLYGSQYEPASLALSVHIWAGLFLAIGKISAKWYIGEGLYLLFLARSGMGLAISFGASWILIPAFGLVGAASATLASVVFVDILFLSANRQTRWLLRVLLDACRPAEFLNTVRAVAKLR